MVLNGINVDRRVVKVWGSGRDESGAGLAEEILEDGERLGTTELHASKLLTVLLTEGGVDRVVKTSGVEGDANGDEGVHLVGLLGDAIVLCVLLEVLCARDVDEDVGEHADGVGVAVHHHVGETDVVVGAELGGHDTGEHGFLVKLNVVQSLEGHAKVTEQAVDAEETDEREVSEHLVERAVTVLAGVGGGVLSTLAGLELLLDLTALDKRVQDVENRVTAPGVGVVAEDLGILVVVLLEGDLLTVGAEAVELVDELVNHLPSPVVLCCCQSCLSLSNACTCADAGLTHVGDLEVDGAIGVEDEVEQVAVAVVAGNLGLEGGTVFEGLSSGGELCLEVLRTAGSDSLEFVIIGVLDLLLVVAGQNLLFDVRVVLDGARGRSLLV